jgi:magnesium chelatase subunit I
VEVRTPAELRERVEVIKRRDEFERDRGTFIETWRGADDKLRRRIVAARKRLREMVAEDAILEKAASLCMQLGTDGLRAELTMIRAARALASFEGARGVEVSHLRRIAPLALRHRLRRDPLDESDATARVERAVAESLAP